MSQAAAQPEKKPRRRIKKVKGHGGHHGGAWKVAYADFVTAMMALFLVLWLVSQADTKLKASIANYFRSPGAFATVAGGVLEGQQKMSKEPQQTNAKLEEQMLTDVAQFLRKQFLDRPEFADYKNQIKIHMTDEGLEIELIDEDKKISFASGNSELTPQAKSILQVIAQGICKMPNQIKIAGYTDSQPFPAGATYTNWELSTDRANTARRVLEETCVPASQINSVIGYADSRPARPDDPFSPENRRISIVLMKGSTVAADGEEESGSTEMPDAGKKGDTSKLEPAMDSDGEEIAEPAGKGEKGDTSDKTGASEKKGAAGEDIPVKGEAATAKHKLQTEGSVSVGEPDVVPTGTNRVKERPTTRRTER